jgi:hypothetical protein
MDLSVVSPDSGASPGASTAAPCACLSREKAKKFFEFFSRGTSRSVILLGRPVEQRMHYIKPCEEDQKRGVRGHKEPCMGVTGSCKWCRIQAESTLVGPSLPEFLAPALIRKGERGEYEQKVAVFTDGMEKTLRDEFGTDSPRGQLFELRRESHQKFKFLFGKARTASAALPAAFDILPFFRARFDLQQDPGCPPVFLPSYSLRELTESAPARTESLALTAADRQSAEDPDRFQATLSKLSDYTKKINGKAPAEPTAQPEDPRLVPGAIKATVIEDIPGGEQRTEERIAAYPPADYAKPKVVQAGATSAEQDELLRRGTGSIVCAEQKARRRAKEEGTERGAAPVAGTLDAILGRKKAGAA